MVIVVERLLTSILYHPGKANVVADSLSHITMGRVSHIDKSKKDLVKEVHRLASLGVRFEGSPNSGVWSIITPSHL